MPTTSFYIADGWDIGGVNYCCTSITVTRARNNLNITGHSTSTTTQYIYIVNKSCELSGILSGRVSYIDNLDNNPLDNLVTAAAKTSTILYNSIFDDNTNTRYNVRSLYTSTNVGIWIKLKPNIDFNITIYDVAVYQGTFCNPPVLTSLDVKPINQFVLKQASQEYFYQNQGVPSQSYLFGNYTNGSNRYEIESLKYALRTSIDMYQHTKFKCKCYLTTIYGNAGGAFHNRNKLFVWDCSFSMDGGSQITQTCTLIEQSSDASYISNPTLSMSGLTTSGGTLKFTLSFTHANYIYSNNHYVFMIIPYFMLPAENGEFIFPTTPISAKKLNN